MFKKLQALLITLTIALGLNTPTTHAQPHSWRALGALLTCQSGSYIIYRYYTTKSLAGLLTDSPKKNRALIKSGATFAAGLYLMWHNHKLIKQEKAQKGHQQLDSAAKTTGILDKLFS